MKEERLMLSITAALIFVVGVSATLPSLALISKKLAKSEIETAMVFSSFSLSFGLLGLPSGLIISKIRREKEICVISSLSTGAIGLSFFFFQTIPAFIVLRLVQGALEIFFFTSLMTLIVKIENRGRFKALGLYFAALGVGAVLGPLLNTLIIIFFNEAAPFLLFTLASLTTSVLLSEIHFSTEETKRRNGGHGKGKINFTFLNFSFPALLVVMVGVLESIIQTYGAEWLIFWKVETALLGVMLTLYYLTSVFSQVFFPKFFSVKKVSTLLPVLTLALGLVISITTNLQQHFIPFLVTSLFGVIAGLNTVYSTNYLSYIVGESRQAVIMGISNSLWSLGYFLGPISYSFFSNQTKTNIVTINVAFILLTLLFSFYQKFSETEPP